MNRKKSILVGLVIGAIFGVLLTGLSLFRIEIRAIQPVINFIVAPPTLIAIRLTLPEIMSYFVLVLYYGVVGFIISWFLSSQSRFRWLFPAAFLIFLLFLHWEADRQLTRDFETLFNMMHNIQVNDLGEAQR